MKQLTQQLKNNTYANLAALLTNPKVVYSNAIGIKLPVDLPQITLQLTLELENEFSYLEQLKYAIAPQTKNNAHVFLTGLLANPKVVYSNTAGQIKLSAKLTQTALELAFELENDMASLEQHIEKRRTDPFLPALATGEK
ncbi:MAG: hypothetical protein DRQ99_22955 [Candidatus Parabeggiatoa sp. nov. 3]|nr:MAG: hypothetical protein DRQ99_22955 [Gammaproteobacteria bacterium]